MLRLFVVTILGNVFFMFGAFWRNQFKTAIKHLQLEISKVIKDAIYQHISPFSPIFNQPDFLAQLVEQQTLNLWVQGSNP